VKAVSHIALAIFILMASASWGKETRTDDRLNLTLSIAHWYRLTRGQAILMCGIYDWELAPKDQMITYGYFGIRRSDHPIIAYCDSDEMLFIVCAGICARTIKRFCPDTQTISVRRFNHGYRKGKYQYPGYAEDTEWWLGVIQKMKEHENILYK
jgi:hypothetical protein